MEFMELLNLYCTGCKTHMRRPIAALFKGTVCPACGCTEHSQENDIEFFGQSCPERIERKPKGKRVKVG